MRVRVGITEGAERGGERGGRGAAGQTLRSAGAGWESHAAVVVKNGDSNHPMRRALGRHVGGFHFCR